MDWKASARSRGLMVRQYPMERAQTVVLLLDVGRLMASRLDRLTKLDHAVNTALIIRWRCWTSRG
ncbi:MAG: DUF58 domain-containing protein [Candidatus Xenobia bacterium]